MQRGQFDLFCVLRICLQAIDVVGFFERIEGPIAQVSLQRAMRLQSDFAFQVAYSIHINYNS